jgi:hypothetical protein
MKQHLLSVMLCAICAYVDVYALLYAHREPAANLAYWAYTTPVQAPLWVESSLYYGFYPIYFVHERLLGGWRHNYDRTHPVYPPGFSG